MVAGGSSIRSPTQVVTSDVKFTDTLGAIPNSVEEEVSSGGESFYNIFNRQTLLFVYVESTGQNTNALQNICVESRGWTRFI